MSKLPKTIGAMRSILTNGRISIKKLPIIISMLFLYSFLALAISLGGGDGIIDVAYAIQGCEGCDGIKTPCSTGGSCCLEANSTANNCHGGTPLCCPE